MKPTLRTFKEWNAAGFVVNKGEKAQWVDGVAKFLDSQVVKKKSYPRPTMGWDTATDENCCHGPLHGIYGNCD